MADIYLRQGLAVTSFPWGGGPHISCGKGGRRLGWRGEMKTEEIQVHTWHENRTHSVLLKPNLDIQENSKGLVCVFWRNKAESSSS